MKMHDPGQDQLIDELFAWVIVDMRTNLESLCGMQFGGGLMQACSSSLETIKKMRPLISKKMELKGKRALLVRFSNREILDEIRIV